MGLGLGSIGAIFGANPSIVSGIGAVAGSVAGDYLQYKGQQDTNEANQTNAREQMAFQERMSNTSHQREVADLRAAGINPVLSANSGASTPAGSTSTAQNPLQGVLKTPISTAMQALQMKKDFAEADSRIASNQASADAQKAAAQSARANAVRTEADTFRLQKDNEWIQNHPNWFQTQKAIEVISPLLSGARDLSSTYRNFKGYIPEKPKKGSADPFMDFEDMPNVRR